MFLHTADENYITARWCFENSLITDFFWNSVHALEKYMKAILLFNGQSVKNYGHNLRELYNSVELIAYDLLPKDLQQPRNLRISDWNDMSPSNFFENARQERQCG
ncbi:HEPN domain-containing protein [Sphingosinithalassobacter portus]|uniref:HEPN domain-containing protein n=1 Tax=Stakelama portus TaxID=2676234 RepID=UPI003B833B2A